MQTYSCEISDMKVCVFSNGLDNLLKKTGFMLDREDDPSDADVILVFSSSEDKAVRALLDKLMDEGVTAGLIGAVYASEEEELHPFLSFSVSASESTAANALGDVLRLMDYYTYINTSDVGALLSDRGRLRYKDCGGLASLSIGAVKTAESLNGKSDAIVLLEVPEDVWISDIEGFAAELSENAPSTYISLSAVRTGSPLRGAAFISLR